MPVANMPFAKRVYGVLPGDAALIVPTDRATLPSILKKAGYATELPDAFAPKLTTPERNGWAFADDIGYGDFSCYGALAVRTPRAQGEGRAPRLAVDGDRAGRI